MRAHDSVTALGNIFYLQMRLYGYAVASRRSLDRVRRCCRIVRILTSIPPATPRQVIFYQADYERMMTDIQKGIIDVGFTQSGWFETNHPDLLPLFNFLDAQPQSYQSEPYPFATTTPLVPSYGLAAGPLVPALLRLQVYRALSALNASHPAAAAAGIATFTLPASYEPARVLVEDQGIMYSNGTTQICIDQFADISTVIACPDGWVQETPLAVAARCFKARLDCPDGLACTCRPCSRDLHVELFPNEAVLGLCATLLCAALAFTVGPPVMDALSAVLARAARAARKRGAHLLLRPVRRPPKSPV